MIKADIFPREMFEQPLDGFDINLIGLDCALEHDEAPDPWECPFSPGCGATQLKDCPARKRLASIAYSDPSKVH